MIPPLCLLLERQATSETRKNREKWQSGKVFGERGMKFEREMHERGLKFGGWVGDK